MMLRFPIGPAFRVGSIWPHALLAACLSAAVMAQPAPLPSDTGPLAPPPNSPRRTEPLQGWFALTGATVHVKPGTTLSPAAIIVRNGRILSAAQQPQGAALEGPDAPPPSNIRSAAGLHIYAGFIEPFVEVDVPRQESAGPGSHWNPRITPERDALDRGAAAIDDKAADTLRSMGFTAAALAPRGGLLRGTAALVSLAPRSADPSDQPPPVYARAVFQAAGFNAGSGFALARGGGDDARWARYPDSQMGAIAIIRQTLSDADWFAAQTAKPQADPQPADALLALAPSLATPLLWDADNELEALRGLAISSEFKRGAIVLGSGSEYRRINALREFKAPVILPLNYPKRPRVATIGEADAVGLAELIAWEQAPTNPRRLDEAGFTVALTTSKVPDKLGGRAAFHDRLAAAIKHGLPPDKALAMLTTNPAQILGVSSTHGTIEKGKLASFVVADGPLFSDRPDAPKRGEEGYVKPGRIIEVWIDGRRYPISDKPPFDLEGDWTLAGDAGMSIEIDADNTVTVVRESIADAKKIRVASRAREWSIDQDGRFSFVYDDDAPPKKGVAVVSGIIETAQDGTLTMHAESAGSDGTLSRFSASRGAPSADNDAAKPFRPTLDALAGTWTIALTKDNKPAGAAKPDDGAHPHVVLSRAKTVVVKRAEQELKVTDVTYDMIDDPSGGSAQVVQRIRYSVHGLTPDAAPIKVVLTPTKERGRLSASTREDGAETFQLVRFRETPESDDISDIPDRLGLPVGPFALLDTPEQQSVIIKNATVWTSAPAGIIETGFVAIQNGKIAHVGDALPELQGEWIEIDAAGKHLTPGIIDCHSHTGISRGVNESGQAVTAEVRIADVTDPDSISWYRQLAGGVTSVNSLHGSANPIGGQNQVNKVRWGCAAPNDMHFRGAIPGIKFALGENVKQSNWGDRNTTRYPQTRMGVETIIRDRFLAARQYQAARAKGARRDLELEALAEILEGKRLVHCHSYRQDEILMLARVAKEFNFTIGTYQHILEGYKVADAVRDSSLGASAFSDWWAYKVEVQDAIPAAGPIMHEVGVVVSYNSDSDEMARRMNIEAGKALKYAGPGMTPAEAFKFVTLNPAKQLKIDDRVGSLEVGKDADVVLWSGPPMSPTSRAERTWVDGRELFSLGRDAELRAVNQRERQRITQKILRQERREKGAPAPNRTTSPVQNQPETGEKEMVDTPPEASARRLLIAESVSQARAVRRDLFLNMLRRNIDLRWARMGDCGCEWSASEGQW